MDNIEELQLTKEQLNAAKMVYKAMKIAGKLGVHFWDDYGTLSCYNANKIERLTMDYEVHSDIEIHENNIAYYETLKNFHAGNSDDRVYANPK